MALTRSQAIAIIAQQVVANVWEEYTEQMWDYPQYGLSEHDWHCVLEEPFIFYPGQELFEAIETLGGVTE